ncbi:MAG: HAMP domain-containing histidine kinase [Marinilabiliaceae bacterium]|nr:HAMP domain-containing histidine kinase [Marinilabiliaceae bacterium]
MYRLSIFIIIKLISCFLFSVNLTAQPFNVDSLERCLESFKGSREEKGALLLNLSNAYVRIDTAKSRIYALETVKFAQDNSLIGLEASGYITLASLYSFTDSSKTKLYATKALSLAQSHKGLEIQQAKALGSLSNYYIRSKQYYLAHVQMKEAEKIFIQLNDLEQLFKVYYNIRILYSLINDKDNILRYANKELELAIKAGDKKNEFLARYNIGKLHFEDKEKQETLDYYLDFYQLSLNENTNLTDNIAADCGNILLFQNRPREALYYLNKVLESNETKLQKTVVMSTLYTYVAEAYAMLQLVDSAEYFLKKSQDEYDTQDYIIPNIERIRSELNFIKGDYRSAFQNYKNFHFLSDSLSQTLKTSEISRIRNWYELEQKDNENELLQQEKQKQQKLITFLTGTLSLIFILFALLIILYRKTVEKNNELKSLHTVKDKLFSVISHDLRAPMATLTSMLKFANKKSLDTETRAHFFSDISTRVDDTFSLLDNLLRWSKNQMKRIVPSPVSFNIRKEIQEITDDLLNIAQAKKITLNVHCEEFLVYADRDMFAVVMRNLLTNAIKYSFPKGEVKIVTKLANDLKMITVSVKDVGIGMSQEVQDNLFKLSKTKSVKGTNNESGTGLGLALCADFVKINSGDIWFNSKEGEGSTFFFSIPMTIDIN